jgi:DNA (cytosine-5)-methyltransferase 1
VKSNLEKKGLPSYLTVQDALSDILKIKPLTKQRVENSTIKYNGPPLTQYQEYLRENSEELYDHFAPNHSEVVRKRMSHIAQGMNHSSLPKEFQLKGGYPNIYGRLRLDSPADTITGNCGCVSAPGRFIHPTQNRAISIREASRLQSFPDRYKFCGTMRDKYKQVGNAVPPLMAYAVAKSINNML